MILKHISNLTGKSKVCHFFELINIRKYSILYQPKQFFCAYKNTQVEERSNNTISHHLLITEFYENLTLFEINSKKHQDNNYKNNLKNKANEILDKINTNPNILSSILKKFSKYGLLDTSLIQKIANTLEIQPSLYLQKLDYSFFKEFIKCIQTNHIILTNQLNQKLKEMINFYISNDDFQTFNDFIFFCDSNHQVINLFDHEIGKKVLHQLNANSNQNINEFLSVLLRIKNIYNKTSFNALIFPELSYFLKKSLISTSHLYNNENIMLVLDFFVGDANIERNILETILQIAIRNIDQLQFQELSKLINLMRINDFYIHEYDELMLLTYLKKLNIKENIDDWLENIVPFIKRKKSINENFVVSLEYREMMAIIENSNQEFFMKKYKEIINFLEALNPELQSKITAQKIFKIAYDKLNTLNEENNEILVKLAILVKTYKSLNMEINQALEHKIQNIQLQTLIEMEKSNIRDQSKIMINILKYLTYINSESASQIELEILKKYEHTLKNESVLLMIQFTSFPEFLNYSHNLKIVGFGTQKLFQSLWAIHSGLFEIITSFGELIATLHKINTIPFLEEMLLSFVANYLKTHKPYEPFTLSSISEVIQIIRNCCMNYPQLSYPEPIKNIINFYGDKCIELIVEKKSPEDTLKENPFAKKPIKRAKPSKPSFDAANDYSNLYIVNNSVNEKDLGILAKIFENIYTLNLGKRDLYGGISAVFEEKFDLIPNEHLAQISMCLANSNYISNKFLDKLEAKLLNEKITISPLEGLKYSWCFTIRNKENQELWIKLANSLNELDPKSLDNKLRKILYQVILSRNIESDSFKVNLSKFETVFDDLDTNGIDDHIHFDKSFKTHIDETIKSQFYLVKPLQKASLYVCDYIKEPNHVILVLGYGNFVSESRKEQGQITLMRRILKRMNFKVHIIDKKSYENEKKLDDKLGYIKTALKGIPQDLETLFNQKVGIDY